MSLSRQALLDGAIRVGIDVGGTNTDAVALDSSDRLLAWVKRPTSPDVGQGIDDALDALLEQLPTQTPVAAVMLGTTHGVNAILQRRDLCKVAVIRVGAPATCSIPPLIGWPDDLRAEVSAGSCIVEGGHYLDGRVIRPLDLDAVRRFVDNRAFDAVAVTSVFSPAYESHEVAVAEAVHGIMGEEFPVSMSHEIGSLGLLARENATVMNAALLRVAHKVTVALTRSVAEHGIQAPVYLAQNDGTLMGGDVAARYPVMTVGSGPANSIRGAAFLTGAKDAIVVDAGGTTTDIGVLIGGFPREAAEGTHIGSVRTNFRMPDVLSIPLGGGTVIRTRDGVTEVGPDSVGHHLADRSWIFGGDTLTLSDAAVDAGTIELGTRRPRQSDRQRLQQARQLCNDRLEDAIETINLGQAFDELIAVGGASFLIDGDHPAIKSVVRPTNAEVANAVGVAAAPVSAQWDTIITSDRDRRSVIDEACDRAASRAVRAGADPRLISIVEMSETPLTYLQPSGSRLRVRASGPLSLTS